VYGRTEIAEFERRLRLVDEDVIGLQGQDSPNSWQDFVLTTDAFCITQRFSAFLEQLVDCLVVISNFLTSEPIKTTGEQKLIKKLTGFVSGIYENS
jgi:hypothetical protein